MRAREVESTRGLEVSEMKHTRNKRIDHSTNSSLTIIRVSEILLSRGEHEKILEPEALTCAMPNIIESYYFDLRRIADENAISSRIGLPPGAGSEGGGDRNYLDLMGAARES